MGLEVLLGEINAQAPDTVNSKQEHVNELFVADTQHALARIHGRSHDTL